MYKLVHCDVHIKINRRYILDTTKNINDTFDFFDKHLSNNKMFTTIPDYNRLLRDYEAGSKLKRGKKDDMFSMTLYKTSSLCGPVDTKIYLVFKKSNNN